MTNWFRNGFTSRDILPSSPVQCGLCDTILDWLCMRLRLAVSYETNMTPNRVLVHLFHDIVTGFCTKIILCSLSNQRGGLKTAFAKDRYLFFLKKNAFNLWRLYSPLVSGHTTLAVVKTDKEQSWQFSWQMILAAYILALSIATLTAQKGEVTMYVRLNFMPMLDL